MTDNIYIVREHGEEGQTSEHGIFTDPDVARGKVQEIGKQLLSFSCVVLTSYKREGAEFVPTVERDPEHLECSVEREA